MNWLRPTLPEFLTPKNKIPVALVWVAIAAVMYGLTNRYPIHPPHMLEMSWIDQALPFVPQTVWIYWSNYVMFAVAYLLARDLGMLSRYFYATIAMQTITCAVFLFWPTTFPRAQFELGTNIDGPTLWLFTALRHQDTPNNCFPSQHVASVFLTSFIFLHEQVLKFPLFFAWAFLIAIATITTKQHYAADVWSGILVSLLCYVVFYHWFRYKPNPLAPALKYDD